jgi:hypothetical protein
MRVSASNRYMVSLMRGQGDWVHHPVEAWDHDGTPLIVIGRGLMRADQYFEKHRDAYHDWFCERTDRRSLRSAGRKRAD